MTTSDELTTSTAPPASGSGASPAPATAVPIARSRRRRLFLGQTALDFWGHRRWWYGVSLFLVLGTLVSLWSQGLRLGIDFEGGVAWDVPAAEFTIEDARDVLADNDISANTAKIQERSSSSGDIIKVQVEDQPSEVRSAVQSDLAAAAGVETSDVSVSSVSSTWGWEITKQAILALAVFLVLIAIYISLRFEWEMAVASLAAMVHDVIISVGIYSVFRFEVTPATVIAFLTILGYSLYDSIVVFDKIKENERRMATSGLSAADLVNVSTNQVLLRSLNTSIASSLPVVALLLIGSGLLGQITLREFAIALLVGMITGAYSSLFIAAPLLGWMKGRSADFRVRGRGKTERTDHLTGDALRAVVVGGVGAVRSSGGRRRAGRSMPATSTTAPGDDADDANTRSGGRGAATGTGRPQVTTAAPAKQLLTHPPRPRKKKRR